MSETLLKEVNAIVKTLLSFVEGVIAVTKDYKIVGSWGSIPANKVPNEVVGNSLLTALFPSVKIVELDAIRDNGLATGEDGIIDHIALIADAKKLYTLHFLFTHPVKDHFFLGIKEAKHQADAIPNDKELKMALEATGDGVWDIDFLQGTVEFSDKWYEIFGYAPGEITTVDQWTDKIHPEDLRRSKVMKQDYLDGKVPTYNAELRFMCKDGSYKWLLSRGISVVKSNGGRALRCIGTHTDIDSRKVTEVKYQATTALLSNLVNNIDGAILVADENRKILFANQRFSHLYGGDEDADTLAGTDIDARLQSVKKYYRMPEEFVKSTHEIMSNRKVVLNQEWEFADGRTFTRDYIPVDLGENQKGDIWQFRDITRQKNTEKKIEELRVFYENILHNIPADIAVFDKDHTYLFVNRHAFKNEELRRWMIGKTDIDYARYSNRPASFVEQRFAMYDNAINGGKRTEAVEKMVNRQGEDEYHLRVLNPVYFENGELEFLMAYGINVTELIKTQEALKTSAETFSSAFNYSGIGMAIVGIDGKLLDVNAALCQMTGYSREELQQLTFQQITHADDLEGDLALMRKTLRNEISTYTLDKRYITKNKKIILVQLTVSLVKNPDGSPRFFISQVIDMTGKKDLEKEIRRRNIELEASKASLMNKVEQLEELSHIIAHNLRGPAGNIKVLSETLLTKHSAEGAAAALARAIPDEQALKFINESSNSLMNSLSTLMAITEIKLNKEIPYDICLIEDIVQDITTQLQSVIFEKGAVINTAITVKQVSYPRAYLENILYNLISNALKYTRPDVAPEIHITVKEAAGRTLIIVKDNGLGINMARYGSRVFKLNQVFHRGFDSKGVGLYITKTQLESLGGTIEVQSEENKGATFTVTL